MASAQRVSDPLWKTVRHLVLELLPPTSLRRLTKAEQHLPKPIQHFLAERAHYESAVSGHSRFTLIYSAGSTYTIILRFLPRARQA